MRNEHEGHRQRLKERFLKEGLDNFQDHNVLELLLFFTIPRKDTNVIAHNLINAFGSLSGVFDATYEQLLAVNGIGSQTATMICLMLQTWRKYMQDKAANVKYVNSAKDAAQILLPKFVGVDREILYMLCMDNKGLVKNCTIISEGTITASLFDNRRVIECAMLSKATTALLAHNHPNGRAIPSKDDLKVTTVATEILKTIHVKLVDHLIFAGEDYFSMAENNKLSLLL